MMNYLLLNAFDQDTVVINLLGGMFEMIDAFLIRLSIVFPIRFFLQFPNLADF